ncbi:hypothetical protein ACW73L_20695 [Methylolobus aquaticus]
MPLDEAALPKPDQELRDIADRFAGIFRQRRDERARAIRDTANVIEQHLQEWKKSLRTQLEEQLRAWDEHGTPLSFVRVAGQRHLEKPLNRLLGWLADPEGDHGLGSEFLIGLAGRMNLPEMVEDLQNGEKPEVKAEEALEDDDSGKQPDLLARTSRAALLLENKVWAPQSGDQYGPYLAVFTQHFAGDRKKRAFLCSRTPRNKPEGWDGTLLHSDLARILHDIAGGEGTFSTWGRIAAVVCAVALEDSEIGEKARQARELLKETHTASVNARHISQLRAAIPLAQPYTPWNRS